MSVQVGMSLTFDIKGAKRSNQDEPATLEVAHEGANTVSDLTYLEQEAWTWDNLPEILYQLNPIGPKSKVKVGMKTYPIDGKFLRDIPVLPDHIPVDVEEFRVEAWIRLDRRIRLEDILDRMPKGHSVKPNALQQRSGRFRQAFSLRAWDSGNKKSVALGTELEQKLVTAGIDLNLNSTRGLTPGLINPVLGEAGGRIPLPALYQCKKLSKNIPKVSKKNKISTRKNITSNLSNSTITKAEQAPEQAPEHLDEEYLGGSEQLCHPYQTEPMEYEPLDWTNTEEFFASHGMPLYEDEKKALRARWEPLPEGVTLIADAQLPVMVDNEDWTWGFNTLKVESKPAITDDLYDKIMQDYHDRELWRLDTLYSGMSDGEFGI